MKLCVSGFKFVLLGTLIIYYSKVLFHRNISQSLNKEIVKLNYDILYFPPGRAGRNNIDSAGQAKVVEPADALTDLLR